MNLPRLIIMFIFVLVSTSVLCQKVNLKKLEKKHDLTRVVGYTPLSNNYVRDFQVFFGIHFSDSTTRIYDRIKDTLSSKVYRRFSINSRFSASAYIGLTNNKWEIYFEDTQYEKNKRRQRFKLVGQYDEKKFDSIKQLDFNYFIGYKDLVKILFYYRNGEKKFKGFIKIAANNKFLKYYKFGVFIQSKNKATNKTKITYLDFKSGKPKSTFTADTIWNLPHTFNDFCIVKKDGDFLVYSYKNDKVIDNEFSEFYHVPIYGFPLIIKDEYIGFGDREWIKLSIPNVVQVEFKTSGDLVYAYVTNKSGVSYKIDLWGKIIIK